jgi:hypothetical protein
MGIAQILFQDEEWLVRKPHPVVNFDILIAVLHFCMAFQVKIHNYLTTENKQKVLDDISDNNSHSIPITDRTFRNKKREKVTENTTCCILEHLRSETS